MPCWPQVLGATAALALLTGAVYLARWLVLFMTGLFLDHPTITLEMSRAEAPDEPRWDREPAVQFLSRDGTELSGWWVRSRQPSRRAAIFFHEFGADGESWRRYLWFLPEAGWHVFTFDFRGSGASGAPEGHRAYKWATAGEVWDAAAALDLVRAQARDEGLRVVGFGASRGAAAMFMAAAAHPWLETFACEGVSAARPSVYWHMRRWARIYVPRWAVDSVPDLGWRGLTHLVLLAAEHRDGVRFPSLEEHLQTLGGRRALFAWGEKDSLIPPGHRRELFRAFAGRRELWTLAGAGHLQGPIACAEEYRQRMLSWLEGTTAPPVTGHP
ncbi:MAG: alpha/beta hydrolase [Candidatus Riflebacteria bacterium]|nr:alpha/beta hydrolase [Candidatus Riflebacteria bacterium]